MTEILHSWHPIEDLPDNWSELESSELRALADVWSEQSDMLKGSANLKVFNERLQRQWAIETGIIERVYSLDRGTTQLLIEQGIDASLIPNEATDKDPQLVAAIIRDHEEAVEGLFDFVGGARPLSTSYIKELHTLLTRHQQTCTAIDSLGRQVEVPLLRGEYKQQPNNPARQNGSIHEYSPPEHVAAEMDELIRLHAEHKEKSVPPELEAAWFHHRFTQIHPFQDGNGRVVRALATLILLRAGWFPLVVTRDDRLPYIEALEAADARDLAPLVSLFSSIERRAFVNALGIAGDVLQRERVDQVIAATRDQLQRRRDALIVEWQAAKHSADTLLQRAGTQFEGLAEKLDAEVGSYFGRHRFYVDIEPPDGDRVYYFRRQIIEAARELGYFANTSEHRSWGRLILRTDSQAEILISFHGIGHEFRGILVASMSFFRREETEQGEREVSDIVLLSSEVFQINYREPVEKVTERFDAWVDRGLVKGLELWRVGL
jgi:Fic family protein